MPLDPKLKVKIGPLKAGELEEASRIARLAFGTFLGMPDPLEFMGDRDFLAPRFRSKHVRLLAARDGNRLIGSNAVTRWGSFGFFGPLTVLPEYWDCGVAQLLLEATMKIFDDWGVRHTGLFTFPHSAKHVGLYQKFGYWPRYLTAIMTRTPENGSSAPALFSALPKTRRAEALESCARLTHKVDRGLDLSDEISAAIRGRTGDVVFAHARGSLGGFAICMHGPGTEGGGKICYIKFAAARDGDGFSALLGACDRFAAARGLNIEAGVNLAREDAFRRMRAQGYRAAVQGVAMQRPHAEGFNRADAYVIDDWR
jgi:GNAT superfamily N-acetyltransferase